MSFQEGTWGKWKCEYEARISSSDTLSKKQNKENKKPCLGILAHAFNASTWEGRQKQKPKQMEICDIQTSLVFIASSKPAENTMRPCLLEKK